MYHSHAAIIRNMANPMANLEALIEGFFEEKLISVFSEQALARKTTLAVARRFQLELAQPAFDATEAIRFQIQLHPMDAATLRKQWDVFAAQLSLELLSRATEASHQLRQRPQLILFPDSSTARGAVQVVKVAAVESRPTRTLTRQTKTVLEDVAATPIKQDFLIIDGERHVSLNNQTLTIGRQHDNQIVLDDNRVSRYHAQVQHRYKHWILRDLGSSLGTIVNGQPIKEYVLQPGDVIQIGTTQLIYAREAATTSTPSVERPATGGSRTRQIRSKARPK